MKHLPLLLSFFIVLSATAQNPKDYFAFPQEQKELVFLDEFDIDDSLWGAEALTAPEKQCKICGEYGIEDDTFFYKNYDTVGVCLCKQISVNYSRNFEISFRTSVVTDTNIGSGTLLWGRKDSIPTANYFYYFYNGSTKLYYCDAENLKDLCPYKYCSARGKSFRQNTYSIYTIRKYNKHYYLFINGVFKKKTEYVPLSGEYMCIGVDPGIEIKVDFLKIFYLPD